MEDSWKRYHSGRDAYFRDQSDTKHAHKIKSGDATEIPSHIDYLIDPTDVKTFVLIQTVISRETELFQVVSSLHTQNKIRFTELLIRQLKRYSGEKVLDLLPDDFEYTKQMVIDYHKNPRVHRQLLKFIEEDRGFMRQLFKETYNNAIKTIYDLGVRLTDEEMFGNNSKDYGYYITILIDKEGFQPSPGQLRVMINNDYDHYKMMEIIDRALQKDPNFYSHELVRESVKNESTYTRKEHQEEAYYYERMKQGYPIYFSICHPHIGCEMYARQEKMRQEYQELVRKYDEAKAPIFISYH
jgi:hypothetical protein